MTSNANIEFRKIAKTEIIVFLIILSILTVFIVFAVIPLFFSSINSYHSKDKANAVNLKTAIIAYDTDYGNLPIPYGSKSTSSDLILGSAPGMDPSLPPLPGTANLFQGLCGNVNAYSGVTTTSIVTGINSRNIEYLTLQRSQVDQDGILVQSFQSSRGTPTYFGIMLDTNDDNTLKGLPDPSTGTFHLQISDTVAVWCNNNQSYLTPNIRWSTTY